MLIIHYHPLCADFTAQPQVSFGSQQFAQSEDGYNVVTKTRVLDADRSGPNLCLCEVVLTLVLPCRVAEIVK